MGNDEPPEVPLFAGEPEHCSLCGEAGHTHDDHWLFQHEPVKALVAGRARMQHWLDRFQGEAAAGAVVVMKLEARVRELDHQWGAASAALVQSEARVRELEAELSTLKQSIAGTCHRETVECDSNEHAAEYANARLAAATALAERLELALVETTAKLNEADAKLAAVERFRGDGLSALSGRMSESVCEDIDIALYDALAGQPAATASVTHLECQLCGDPLDSNHPTGPCVPCHELPERDEPAAPDPLECEKCGGWPRNDHHCQPAAPTRTEARVRELEAAHLESQRNGAAAALRVRELEEQERNAAKLAVAHADARWTAESRLAAATALLHMTTQTVEAYAPGSTLAERARAFLAGQPAEPTRTEADNLSASDRIELECWRTLFESPEANAARLTELARRGAEAVKRYTIFGYDQENDEDPEGHWVEHDDAQRSVTGALLAGKIGGLEWALTAARLIDRRGGGLPSLLEWLPRCIAVNQRMLAIFRETGEVPEQDPEVMP